MRPLLGPILFIMDVSPETVRFGIVVTACLLLVIGLGVWKRWWSVVIVAAIAWLLLGEVANGINC